MLKVKWATEKEKEPSEKPVDMLIVELHESSRAAADNAKRGTTDFIY